MVPRLLIDPTTANGNLVGCTTDQYLWRGLGVILLSEDGDWWEGTVQRCVVREPHRLYWVQVAVRWDTHQPPHPTPRFYWHNQCDGKRRYKRRGHARKAMRQQQTSPEQPHTARLCVYRCPWCDWYHIGNPPQGLECAS